MNTDSLIYCSECGKPTNRESHFSQCEPCVKGAVDRINARNGVSSEISVIEKLREEIESELGDVYWAYSCSEKIIELIRPHLRTTDPDKADIATQKPEISVVDDYGLADKLAEGLSYDLANYGIQNDDAPWICAERAIQIMRPFLQYPENKINAAFQEMAKKSAPEPVMGEVISLLNEFDALMRMDCNIDGYYASPLQKKTEAFLDGSWSELP